MIHNHDVQSITKGVIGLLYCLENIDTNIQFLDNYDATLYMALNYNIGMDDDKDFDYDEFRKVYMDGKGDVMNYVFDTMNKKSLHPEKNKFGYSNLVWQILSYKLQKITNKTCDQLLEKYIGKEGWYWEKDCNDICLGMHGLYMDLNSAKKIAQLVFNQPIFFDLSLGTVVPEKHWYNKDFNYKRSAFYGWFRTNEINPSVWTHGYMVQYILCNLKSKSISIQLCGNNKDCFNEQFIKSKKNFLIKELEKFNTESLDQN